MASVKKQVVEVVDYTKLVDESLDLTQFIEKTFGYEGLGILAVRGVPGYIEKRRALLPLAWKFASLPEEIKQLYCNEPSFYSFGWSHGKEKLEGKPDFAKGSYYNNPIYDHPSDDEELIAKYPSFLHPNIWPKEHLPELEPAFKEFGQLIVEVGQRLAFHIDSFVHKVVPSYSPTRLCDILKNSRIHKGRLLNYFPLNQSNDQSSVVDRDGLSEISSWCGWHNDHGSLTGLAAAMFFDEHGNEIENPDPSSGLYIRSRQGSVVKVSLPADCLAFQIGETAQIHSGGKLQATPHCVRGSGIEGITRTTFAIFMEPNWYEPMQSPIDLVDAHLSITQGSSSQHLPPGVPTLSSRWSPDMNFGQFHESTLKAYY